MSSTISSPVTHGITLGSGTYSSPLTITSGGGVTASSGNAIFGPNTQAWTVINDGTVQTPGGTIGDNGVILNAGGYVGNGVGAGTTTFTTALISGQYGIEIFGTAGTVTNFGTITGVAEAIYLSASTSGVVINHGVVQATRNGVYISGAPGTITNTDLISGATSGIGVILYKGGTVIDSGTINGGTAGTAIRFGSSAAGQHNLLEVYTGYKFGGAINANSADANTFEIGGTVGGTATAFSSLTLQNFNDVAFGSAGNNRLDVAQTSGTFSNNGTNLVLQGFSLGSDVIDLTGLGAPVGYSVASNQLTVTGANGTVIFNLDASDGTHFAVQSDGSTGTDIICYCAGTRILTEKGEVAVEDLAIGDRVVTWTGAPRPIKWIGRRAYAGPIYARNPHLWPIRIAAGALAEGVPHRDLLVSPKHALYLDGLLLPAESLVNGATIRREEGRGGASYYHLELDSHDVIWAEGAAAETYIDCDNRGIFHNAAEFARLYPDDARPRWAYCAPLVEDGPERDRIWRRLARRARLEIVAASPVVVLPAA